MNGLVDTHFHLDMYKNYKEIYNYLEEQKQYTLCMTNSPSVFLSCKDLFPRSKYVQFALGFHPLNKDLTIDDIKSFRNALALTNYVGEIGLDFSKKNAMEKQLQIKCFDEIVSLCAEKNKLMSIHIRNADKEALRIIEKYRPRKCIIHWYSGKQEYVDEYCELGCYFSVNANMLKNVEVIKRIPKEKILIESDGPHSKVDGKRYEPRLLIREYELIAKAIENPDLIEQVYYNFKNLLLVK